MRKHECSKCHENEPVSGGYCRACHNRYMREARKLGKWRHDSKEYKMIRVGQKTIREHRLVLGLTDPRIHGHHKNGKPRDNRPENLFSALSNVKRSIWKSVSNYPE